MRSMTSIQSMAGRMKAERAYKAHREEIRREAARVAALTPEQAHDELMAACAIEDKLMARALKGMK